MLKVPSFRLDGKRALVVGASSGIGQACALALAHYGASLVIAARRASNLEETKAMIQSNVGSAQAGANGQAEEQAEVQIEVQIEVMDIADIKATQQCIKDLGAFDILINAAGLARHSPALETTVDDFDAVTGVNFKSAYFVTRAVAAGMIADGRSGSLINVSSQMAHIGGYDRALYSGTKHAVEGMTKSMAMEWGKFGIRVNTICPTFIRTALTASTFDDPKRVEWIKEKIKLGRVGEVEDIMGTAVFLASDASALITGTSILVDGGWTAG